MFPLRNNRPRTWHRAKTCTFLNFCSAREILRHKSKLKKFLRRGLVDKTRTKLMSILKPARRGRTSQALVGLNTPQCKRPQNRSLGAEPPSRPQPASKPCSRAPSGSPTPSWHSAGPRSHSDRRPSKNRWSRGYSAKLLHKAKCSSPLMSDSRKWRRSRSRG